MKEMKLDRHEFNLLVNDILLDVKPVKLRITIANRLIEFFDKKQERIAELEEQLKNAIVPKFKIGQECWGIVPKTFWNKESYTIHFKVKAYIPDNNGIVLMLEDSITNLHYSYEWQVFATKEEALTKLEELKGENK